jgi:N-acetyl-anhydromuramyl-L-alanine amidase AmpD
MLGAEFLVAGDHDYASLLRRMAAPDCYSAAQIEAGAQLYAGWARAAGFSPSAIVGHSDVAGDDVRGAGAGKRDPGAGFPWSPFRARVIELLNASAP